MEKTAYILTIAVVFISLFALFIVLRILLKRYFLRFGSNNTTLTKNFFDQLDMKYELGLIKNKDDIIVLADSFKRDNRAVYELNTLLEDYLRHLVEIAASSDENLKSILIERHCYMNEILKIEKEEKPYSDLPTEERRIFRSINSSIKENNKENALYNLEDLRILFSTKNKIYQQSSFLNKLSIPLAIFGLLLTIYFGYRSISSGIENNDGKKAIELDTKFQLKKDTIIKKE